MAPVEPLAPLSVATGQAVRALLPRDVPAAVALAVACDVPVAGP